MNTINNVRTNAATSTAVTARETVCRRTAYEAALEGIVLLKNDGVMPLKPGKVALYGAGAEKTIKGGTGSGEVNERHSVGIREGLENAGYTITTAAWLEDYNAAFRQAEDDYAAAMSKRLKSLNLGSLMELLSEPFIYPFGREITEKDITEGGAEACIYVVSRQSGEGVDRSIEKYDINLSPVERKNIEIAARAYKKTIVVINAGGYFDCSFAEEIPGVNALVFFCQQGCEGGNAFAAILSGASYPSGHLADTWAKSYGDIPFGGDFAYLNGNTADEYYREGVFVGYRYFDTFGVKPAFPFGFGLGYASFKLSGLKAAPGAGGKVSVSAVVTNASAEYRGREVVQVYVLPPRGKIVREYQLLAAFGKTKELAPGESETLTLTVDFAQLGAFDEGSACTVLEAGDYQVRAGFNSAETQAAGTVSLAETVTLSEHCHICPQKTPVQELVPQNVPASPAGAKISLGKDDFVTKTFEYNEGIEASGKAKDAAAGLSAKELTEVVVGGGMFPGSDGFQSPGAAGRTTGKLAAKGIGDILVADGPAGVRLQRTSSITRSGKVKMIDAQIAFLNYFPPFIKKFMFGNPKKDTLIYQYTTAFPVGMALAQTWNMALLEKVGDAVGTEMEEYCITFWLAPGMNIHRNPLCGRNYEYFSEDPLLSGKAAAALTRGVQKHKGRYVTLKHYACNNQETSRNKTSANLSERALREIYLKGYEIAVKESSPGGVMTSYNKVNGVYASNSHDLCTKALRCEWGFGGLVMSDWFSNGKGLADAGLAVKAGNDLLMPGTGGNKKVIAKALAAGAISLDDLRRCAARVLQFIVQ
jgi:beta-glucosidase